MIRVALQLSDSFLDAVTEFAGVECHETFSDHPYAIVEAVSPTEFNFKLVTEDEIVEAVKHDCDMQVVSF